MAHDICLSAGLLVSKLLEILRSVWRNFSNLLFSRKTQESCAAGLSKFFNRKWQLLNARGSNCPRLCHDTEKAWDFDQQKNCITNR